MGADRLVSLGGKVFDPDYDKVWIVEWTRARLVAGMTGIAFGALQPSGSGVYSMIASSVHLSICDNPPVPTALERLRSRLQHQISLFQLPPAKCGLAIALLGHERAPARTPFGAIITNLDADGRAQSTFHIDGLTLGQSALALSVGYQAALNEDDLREVRQTTARGADPRKVRSLILRTLSHAARSSVGRKYIGREFNTAILPSDPNAATVVTYHSGTSVVNKHPAFITPTSICVEMLVESPQEAPISPRRARRRYAAGRSHVRLMTQFSPRDCPSDNPLEVLSSARRRETSYALGLLQSYLIEHADSAPPELRPTWARTVNPDTGGTAEGWSHAQLPAELDEIARKLRTLVAVCRCEHGTRTPAVCAEGRRFINSEKCAECAHEYNGFMEWCDACSAYVCSNEACPLLAGNRLHVWNPWRATVDHTV